MSEERMELLRRVVDAFNRGDYDAASESFHPEIELMPPGDQSPYRGAESVREWMKPAAFSKQSGEIRALEEAGDMILMHLRTSATGAGSGLEVNVDAWGLWSFDDSGLITRVAFFFTGLDARRAAGLSE